MKHSYFFKTTIICLMLLFTISSVNAQKHRSGAYIGAAIPVGKFASDKDIFELVDEFGNDYGIAFSNAASAGFSLTGRYSYLWDGAFSQKDAMGVFGEVSLVWNSTKKIIKDYYKDQNQAVPSYLMYSIAIGPTYRYYLGKDETISIFGEAGVLLGSFTLTNMSYSSGLGIGGTFGAGMHYNEWLSVGLYYQFLSDISKKTENMMPKITPSVLQLKVGFHF